MSMIRNYTVDLLKYLPEFLAQSPEMTALMNVESKEHILQEAALQDIFKQFFISSATWGLSAWERNLEITPNADDTYQQRRNRIYLKLQGRQTSTKEFMVKLAARYFSEDAVLEPIEDNPNETFWIIDHGGTLLYAKDLFEAIDTYIPAHLGFGLHFEREIHMEAESAIRVGLASISSGATKFGIRHPPKGVLDYGVKVLSGDFGLNHIDAGPNILRANSKELLGLAMGEYRRSTIRANAEDLPEPMKNILKSSRAAPRIGFSILDGAKTRTTINRPATANTPMGAGFFIGKTGRDNVLPESPKDGSNLQYTALIVTVSGRTLISANMDDLKPPEGNTPDLVIRVGNEVFRGGERKITPNMPDDSSYAMKMDFVVVNTGRSVIPANLEDMNKARIRTNAVGRMHVGLAHIGI